MRRHILRAASRLAAAMAVVVAGICGCVDGGGNSGGDSSVDEFLGWVKGSVGNNTNNMGGYDFGRSCGNRPCDTMRIGKQVWMSENLNYQTENGTSWCYRESDSCCAKYGRLYTWHAAKKACPDGWHLPSGQEWDQLASFVGGQRQSVLDGPNYSWSDVGKKLKMTSGWDGGGVTGTDDFGFSALPGGYFISYTRQFTNEGSYGAWWTATEYGGGDAYVRMMNNWGYNDDMHAGGAPMSYGYSVRCVKSERTLATYKVTVTSAGAGSNGGGDYAVDAKVTISAGTAPNGQRFKNWTTSSDDVFLADAESETTWFTMPSNAVEVTANFRRILPDGDGGMFRYGNQEYGTVVIGGVRWMAKNLNMETADSWCYNNSEDSCAKYGRLYRLSAAKAACQSMGWRLPSRYAWDQLTESVGGQREDDGTLHRWLNAGKKLKMTSGWYSDGNGTDDYRFSALPGGSGDYDGGDFKGAGSDGIWWTASDGYCRMMSYDHDNVREGVRQEKVYVKGYGNGAILSVRCIADD